MTRLLRILAWAIAIGAAIDPGITLSGASRARLSVMVTQPQSPATEAARDRLTRDLSAEYDIVPHVVSDAAAAIVIGDRYPDEAVADAMLVATVSASDRAAAGVRIVRVDAPAAVPAATLVHLDVEVEASLVAGQTTDLTVSIADLETGRASHRWTRDQERWHASVDAVPVGDPPYVVRVRLKPDTAHVRSKAMAVERRFLPVSHPASAGPRLMSSSTSGVSRCASSSTIRAHRGRQRSCGERWRPTHGFRSRP